MSETNGQFQEARSQMAELTDMIMDQIRKLSELHEERILTDEKFTAKKQELLSRL